MKTYNEIVDLARAKAGDDVNKVKNMAEVGTSREEIELYFYRLDAHIKAIIESEKSARE